MWHLWHAHSPQRAGLWYLVTTLRDRGEDDGQARDSCQELVRRAPGSTLRGDRDAKTVRSPLPVRRGWSSTRRLARHESALRAGGAEADGACEHFACGFPAVEEAALVMPSARVSEPTNTTPAVEIDDLADHLHLLRQVVTKINRLTNLRSDLTQRIKAALDDDEIGTIDGIPVVSFKRELRVALSQKLLKERHPEVIPECEEITEVRRFLLLS